LSRLTCDEKVGDSPAGGGIASVSRGAAPLRAKSEGLPEKGVRTRRTGREASATFSVYLRVALAATAPSAGVPWMSPCAAGSETATL